MEIWNISLIAIIDKGLVLEIFSEEKNEEFYKFKVGGIVLCWKF